MADDGMKIQVDGKEYAVDDFEGRELVDAERSFGISLFAELDRGSVTGVYALVYLIKKRQDKTFTADRALALNLGEVSRMIGQEEEVPPSKPAAQRAKKPA